MAEETPNSSESTTAIHPAIGFWQKEWRVIKTWSFWVAIGIVGIGIFIFLQFHYGELIADKDAMIQRAEQDRDSYKQNLDESQHENSKLKAAEPSGFVTNIVLTVTSITNIEIVTQLVSSVGLVDSSRYASETISNLVDGNKIILENEPIPQTIKVWVNLGLPRFVPLKQNATLDGNVITFTNLDNAQVKLVQDRAASGIVVVEYVKKLHDKN